MQLDMPVIDSSVVLVKVVVMAVVSQNVQTGLIQYILIDRRLCSILQIYATASYVKDVVLGD